MARTGALSSAIMAAGTMVSRVLGFVKTFLITIALGSATTVGDVFETSNTLPNLIYVLVAGGIFNAVLVPQIIKAAKHDDGGSDFVSRLVTLAVTGIFAVTVVVVVCAWPIITVMGRGWSPEQRELGFIFALWCFPQILFYGIYTIIGQVLNARGAFGWFMWAPVVNNVVAIIGVLGFIWGFGAQRMSNPPLHSLESWTSTQTLVLAGSATLGVICQALILLLPLRTVGLKLRPKFKWRGMGLGDSAKLAGWTLATGIVSNLAFLYLTRVAAGVTGARAEYLEQGIPILGVAALNYSSMLYSLPHGVIGLSIATVLFNRMSEASQGDDAAGLRHALSAGLRVASVATVFCAVALVVFAGPVGMIFSGGDPVVGAQIGQVLAVISLGGPFLTIAFMMGRVFYAQEDAKTPFYIQVFSALLIVVAGFAASQVDARYTIFALAGTYATQNILAVYLSHRVLARRLGDYGQRDIVRTHAQVALASFCSALVGAVALWLLGGFSFAGFAWQSQLTALLAVAVGGVVMAIAYYAFLQIFQVREFDQLADPIRSKLARR
ncbi:murein biosynthesis integral membrane protein MurJ [Rothia sp. ZJ932]|uniref:murein biosynthesis integral membrane protein MurJ n=1 Tax=Rothia sp. ZJ932 TaxID=2810516 RepID=UPI001967218C|nr:murein biosynthesis integral membrane protein MurJ [Rothia sp. ZJ932]QRZ61569.1 murein biosynthesis integral membrane protein MurJ [Rothia sp. ZJ932]